MNKDAPGNTLSTKTAFGQSKIVIRRRNGAALGTVDVLIASGKVDRSRRRRRHSSPLSEPNPVIHTGRRDAAVSRFPPPSAIRFYLVSYRVLGTEFFYRRRRSCGR